MALTPRDGGFELRVRAAPGARREGVVGVHDGAVKVAVQAPPERGRANDRLLRVLADALGVPRRALSLAAGATSRDKIVRVCGVAGDDLAQRLARLVGDGG